MRTATWITAALLATTAGAGVAIGQAQQTNETPTAQQETEFPSDWTLLEAFGYCQRALREGGTLSALGVPTQQLPLGDVSPPAGWTPEQAQAFCQGVLVSACVGLLARSGESVWSLLGMTPNDVVNRCPQVARQQATTWAQNQAQQTGGPGPGGLWQW